MLIGNDNKLIVKARNGDEKAFEKLMNNYLKDIYNYIYFQIKSQDDVQDILQEVMLAAYQSICKFESKSSLKTWLLGITRYKINDFYREKYAQKTIPLGEDNHYSFDNRESMINKMNINMIIETLPKEDRELIHLVFNLQLSYKEIEEMTQIPVGTIKSRIHYIKEKLKPLLKEDRRSS